MDKEMSLEQANDLLEQTIKQLENRALPMDKSIELYAKACELLSYCMKKLDAYKGRIEQIDQKLAQDMTEDNYG